MKIYRLSIVERDGPPDNRRIIDFREDFEFRKLERLVAKFNQLIKKGHTWDTLDLTTWSAYKLREGGYDYDITFDPPIYKTLKASC